MNRFLRRLPILILVTLLAACGAAPQREPGQKNITAIFKASALTAERNIAGIQLTISVPVGVAPPLNSDGTVNSEATVVITRGAVSETAAAEAPGRTLVGAIFTPPAPAVSGKLVITALVADGFKTTDEVTINLNVAADATPAESDFALLIFDAFDTAGALVTGLTPSLTTTIH
jgi:hypothetical protein